MSLSSSDATNQDAVVPSNLVVRADQFRLLSDIAYDAGIELSWVSYPDNGQFVRVVLPFDARTVETRDALTTVLNEAGLIDTGIGGPLDLAVKGLYRGDLTHPTANYGDVFLGFDPDDDTPDASRAITYSAGLAVAPVPSNFVIVQGQFGAWADLFASLDVEVDWSAYAPDANFVRIVLPDSDRTSAIHDKIAGALFGYGLANNSEELQLAMQALYRGDVNLANVNPNQADAFLAIDPETNKVYASRDKGFGEEGVSDGYGSASIARIDQLANEGLATKVKTGKGDFAVITTWNPLANGFLRLVYELKLKQEYHTDGDESWYEMVPDKYEL